MCDNAPFRQSIVKQSLTSTNHKTYRQNVRTKRFKIQYCLSGSDSSKDCTIRKINTLKRKVFTEGGRMIDCQVLSLELKIDNGN